MSSPLVYVACVIVLGVAAQWFAWRTTLPAILVLLATGFLLGRWVQPGEFVGQSLLSAGVSLSVAVILFEGGLSLRLRDLAETGPTIFRLVTIGCVVTWFLVALFARWLVFDTLAVAALAGAILSVTGPTVIGPLLRHVRPHRRPGAVLRWEGIVIDPIGALLAVLVYEAIPTQEPQAALAVAGWGIAATAMTAALVGGGGAALIVLLLRKHWLPDFLHAPTLLAIVLGAFTLANQIQSESGLAAVTVLGLALANQKFVSVEHITKFKESLGVLLLGVLFIVLAGTLRPEDLTTLGWRGAVFLALLILVIRPLAVLLATARSPLNWSERAFIAGLAPRGIVAAAVSSVFALALSQSGPSEAIREDAQRLVPLTFLVIVTTVTVYGLTAKPLALRLGIADPEPQGLLIVGAGDVERTIARAVQDEGYAVDLIDSNRENVAAARLHGLRTRHGNVLSESLQDEIELGGLGRLLAMTPSDEVNALAAIAFTGTFERASVFQLPAAQAGIRKKGEGGENRPIARRLFSLEATYEELERRLRAGAVIKKTLLTQEFDYAAFQAQYTSRALVLFIVSKSGDLTVCTAEKSPSPLPGQKLISLVNGEEVPESASARIAPSGENAA